MSNKWLSNSFEQHYIVQSAVPSGDDVQVGIVWIDRDDGEIYVCTSLGPIVFTQKSTAFASAAEIDTGTEAAKAMAPDQFVASDRNIRFVEVRLVASDTDVATGTSIGGDFRAPFTGTIVQDDTNKHYFCAYNDTAGTTGTMVVDVHLNGTTIMTTNKLDIETGEKTTADAATQPDLTTTAITAGDILTFDVDAIHTTAAKGLVVRIPIRLT